MLISDEVSVIWSYTTLLVMGHMQGVREVREGKVTRKENTLGTETKEEKTRREGKTSTKVTSGD